MNRHKIVFLILSIVLTFFLTSCLGGSSGNNGNNTIVNFVPNFQFTQISQKNVISGKLLLPQDNQPNNDYQVKLLYYCLTPAVLSFNKNTAQISNGTQYSCPFLNSTLNVTVHIDESTKIVTFQGVLTDQSGTITIEFNTVTNRFNYDQYIVLQDSPGHTTYLGTNKYAIMSVKLNDVPITSEGYFHVLTHTKCLQPGNVYVADCDIYSGLGSFGHPESSGARIAGFYCNLTREPNPPIDQQELLNIEPLTLGRNAFENYFSQSDTWQNLHPANPALDGRTGTLLYYDFNTGSFFSNNSNIATQTTRPWDLLP